jgi:hypothetical protein
MKTSMIQNKSRLMKVISLNLVMMVIFLIAIPKFSNAQLPSKSESDGLLAYNDAVSPEIGLKSFTASLVEGVVYINWRMKGEPDKSVFMIERSINGGEFESLGLKDGFAAPNKDIELLYCFQDITPLTGNNVYRIKQFAKGGIMYSQNLNINVEEQIPLVEIVNK